jgi:ADP-ribose pyrophosphatase YjhB (NUDIX family)
MRRLWHFIKTVIGLIFRHPLLGTSIIARLSDQRIVLVKRRDNGLWGLPGGMVDWGEDIATSVRRELSEETGLQLVQIRRLVGVYSSPNRDPRIHSVCVVVEVDAEGQMHPADAMEILDVQAFDPADLPQGRLSHDHRQQLNNYLQGQITLA